MRANVSHKQLLLCVVILVKHTYMYIVFEKTDVQSRPNKRRQQPTVNISSTEETSTAIECFFLYCTLPKHKINNLESCIKDKYTGASRLFFKYVTIYHINIFLQLSSKYKKNCLLEILGRRCVLQWYVLTVLFISSDNFVGTGKLCKTIFVIFYSTI